VKADFWWSLELWLVPKLLVGVWLLMLVSLLFLWALAMVNVFDGICV